MFFKKVALLACLSACFSGCFSVVAAPNIDTAVVSEKQAKYDKFDWGKLYTYFEGESAGTKDALTAVAVILPGMEIHPPHKHQEEEYLMVLEGQGTWTVGDKDFPASAGDILYATPWDLHGIKNTGDKPLKFVVFKWGYKPGQ